MHLLTIELGSGIVSLFFDTVKHSTKRQTIEEAMTAKCCFRSHSIIRNDPGSATLKGGCQMILLGISARMGVVTP